MTAEAFAMRIRLAKLAQRHGVASRPCVLPLADAIEGSVELNGYLSTTHVDLEHTKFRGWAFVNPCLLLESYPKPPLLWAHQADQVAGTITSLRYDDHGCVKISADVCHQLGKRAAAFSLAARVLEYEIVNPDSRDYFALVSKAEIIECSLTCRPANPFALVQSRRKAAPFAAFLEHTHQNDALLRRALENIARQVDVIGAISCTSEIARPAIGLPPRPAVQPRGGRVRAPVSRSSRGSSFSSMVAALNAAHPPEENFA
jgi:hypothetical protein